MTEKRSWYERVTCPNCYVDRYGVKWCMEQVGSVRISTHKCDGKLYKECVKNESTSEKVEE